MSNVYKEALVKKVNELLAQLQKEDDLKSHVGSQVKVIKSLVLEEKLEQALEQAKLLVENAIVLSSAKVINLCFDLRGAIEGVIKMQEKGEESVMKTVYDHAREIKEEAAIKAQQEKKASIKEANLEVEMKCESAPCSMKMSIKGIKLSAYGNEFEMESMELEGSADISNFIMAIKGMMSKK